MTPEQLKQYEEFCRKHPLQDENLDIYLLYQNQHHE